ncbi:MAG: hypothetical protein A2076_00620 [Geobacteraceae bacterium GWC2_53_11]|nr:MAG: hypothetical protein A2076_00620 [Geobacteraceae bacterium GWC2_53_11]
MQWFGDQADVIKADRSVAVKTVASYALFSSLWIALSDVILKKFVPDPTFLGRINFFKDILFIFLTITLLYQLIKRYSLLAHQAEETKLRLESNTAALDHFKASHQDALKNLAIVADGVPTLIAHMDLNQRYLYVNANYATWVGRPEHEIVGATVREVIGEEIYQTTVGCIRQVLSGRFAFMKRTAGLLAEERIQHMSFVPRFDEQGAVISYFALINDITDITQTEQALQASVTEQRRIEEQLRQAQKMEAIGTMAGGVAHDFNNILTIILGCAEMMQSRADETYPHSGPYLGQIIDAANRAAGFTRSLLAFSRQQGIEMAAIDLNGRIRQLEELLKRIIGEDITITLSLGSQQLNVMADGGQMDQVIMNMISNARDAMPQGGCLTITTYQTEHALPPQNGNVESTLVPCAVLEIADTGSGMNSATLERIFDPFYTTKEVGKGTGLGLSMAYGIVKSHNGVIDVTSEQDKGATFRIILPCVTPAPARAPKRQVPLVMKGNETILLVEDDPVVRHMVKTLLQRYDYRILTAQDGEEGLDLFRNTYEPVHLILSDVIMPRKNGIEMCREIRALHPGIPVIFMSGYAADFMDKLRSSGEAVNFIAKPLNMPLLLKTLREALATAYPLPAPDAGSALFHTMGEAPT